MNTKLKTRVDEDMEDDFQSGEVLDFYTSANTTYTHEVPIDEPIVSPSYYRKIVQLLRQSSPNDLIIFEINSPGGFLSGLNTLLEAIKITEATTVAYIVGTCASAAGILALHCDDVVVGDGCDFLAHHVSYGTSGRGSDIMSHTQHVARTSEKLIRETYAGFLTETEITELLAGRQIYFDADDVRERLANREEFLMAEMQKEDEEFAKIQAALEVQAETQSAPKKPSRKKVPPKE